MQIDQNDKIEMKKNKNKSPNYCLTKELKI